jgi:putative copper export protein
MLTAETTAALLAGCRWLLYVAVMSLVGVAGARWVIRRSRSAGFEALQPGLDDRLIRSALALTALWIVALVATLAVNVVAWFGPAGLADLERLEILLFQTRWGQSWQYSFGAAVVALSVGVTARLVRVLRPAALVVVAAAAILSTPLIGHAAGHGVVLWSLHAIHFLGTGLWLGTLLILSWHTWPLWRDASLAPGALRRLLRAFTPIALTGAAVAVASGVGISLAHIWPPQSAFQTLYGMTLVVKVAVVIFIAGLGWLNWRRFGPVAEEHAIRRRRLRRSVVAELALAFVLVLALTAWLAGLPTPE